LTLATTPGRENVTEGLLRKAHVARDFQSLASVTPWIVAVCKIFPKNASPALHFFRYIFCLAPEAFRMSAPIVWRAVPLSLLLGLFLTHVLAAQSGNAPGSTTNCTLDDGRQVYVRYNPVAANKEKVTNGKPMTPGGQPMTLFTEAPLTLGTSTIPIGAYTVYPIPARDHWTLVVNKNVTPGAAYDEKQDVARAPMETAQVAQPSDALEVAFAHVGNRCTLRVYIGKTASFADFVVK
jgi:hypothetical protein